METTTTITTNKKRKEMEKREEIEKKENENEKELFAKFFSYYPKFFDKENENKTIFKQIFENAKWLQEKAIFGNIPTRKACVYGYSEFVSYSYSKTTKPTNDWKTFPLLLEMKSKIEKETKEEYDYVLLNYYPDGNSSIGMHADDEESVSQKHSIVSISFGESRIFRLQHNITRKMYKILLNDGDLFIMKPGTQQEWKHGINKEPKKTNARISLTFRKFVSTK